MAASDFVNGAAINLAVEPSHVSKFLFFADLVKADFIGLKRVSYKTVSNSACFFG